VPTVWPELAGDQKIMDCKPRLHKLMALVGDRADEAHLTWGSRRQEEGQRGRAVR
jgi:hypothetical protein